MTAPAILIVGGSLAGLTLALACARRGVAVRVAEKRDAGFRGGDCLSLDLARLQLAAGLATAEMDELPKVPAYRDRVLVSWPSLYQWLRALALREPLITLETSREVLQVVDMGRFVEVRFSDASCGAFDAVIGADGYRSTVRSALNPTRPLARYAGYVVWRALIEERELAQPVAWPSLGGLWIDYVDGFRLVAAVLPGIDGSLQPEHRQVTFAWFDTRQEALLRDTQCLTADGHVTGTLHAGLMDARLRQSLKADASRIWPLPWTDAVQWALSESPTLTGAPIAEYLPLRMAKGGLALLGDAAHSVSPMTGSGFASAVEDAVMLANCLTHRNPAEPLSVALQAYESTRLPAARALSSRSSQLSADYVGYSARTVRQHESA